VLGVSSVVLLLQQRGGISTRAELVGATSRREVDLALREGAVVRLSHGRYALPALDDAVTTAHAANGVLSHLSAALWHGWEVKHVPDRPHLTFPRKRRVPDGAFVRHRRDLLPEEVRDGICTSAELTLEQCLRVLPFDEGLCVADSALRHGVDPATLRRIAATVAGAGRSKVRRVAREATGDAANPFESCLRAIAFDVPGLRVHPQRVVVGTRQTVRPDLVDEDLRVVLEADSFEWHGSRAALRRDARRYNLLVADGWLVLRFSYEDVMFDPDYVRDVLAAIVDARTQVSICPRCAA
jgi:very-short-patch-repair endonuclease